MNDSQLYSELTELHLFPFPESIRFNGLNTLLMQEPYESPQEEYPSPREIICAQDAHLRKLSTHQPPYQIPKTKPSPKKSISPRNLWDDLQH
ncbi:MAG: hypothetical protein AABX11_06145 [Nanoarchaeota archaeon]